jgi:hypothetical protein
MGDQSEVLEIDEFLAKNGCVCDPPLSESGRTADLYMRFFFIRIASDRGAVSEPEV